MKKKKYKHSKKSVMMWCDTLGKYVQEMFCRRSKDAKMITKIMNDQWESGQSEKAEPSIKMFDKLKDSASAEIFNSVVDGKPMLKIDWALKGCGFGEFVFWQDESGKIVCDNECMSRKYVAKVFALVADSVELACGEKDD